MTGQSPSGATLAVFALSATTLLVGVAYGLIQQREQRAATPLLPVTFAHADHRAHSCTACHHNFIDNTGQGFCYGCHKSDATIASDMEAMFHGLCRDCHVELAIQHEPHGPVRACQQCHVADMRP